LQHLRHLARTALVFTLHTGASQYSRRFLPDRQPLSRLRAALLW